MSSSDFSYGAVGPSDTFPTAEEEFRSESDGRPNKSRKWYILVVTGVVVGIVAAIVLATGQMGGHSGGDNPSPPATGIPFIPGASISQMLYNTTESSFQLIRIKEEGSVPLFPTVALSGSLGLGTVQGTDPDTKGVDVYGNNVYSWTAANAKLQFGLVGRDCWRLVWSVLNTSATPITSFTDCFDLGADTFWYGGGEELNQVWPLGSTGERPFKTHNTADPAYAGSFGGILHPVWMSSKGAIVNVSTEVPLLFSMNASSMCLRADPALFGTAAVPTLDYTMCATDTLYKARMLALFNVKPTTPTQPSSTFINNVVFDTTAALGSNYNQTDLTAWAQSIADNKNVTEGSVVTLRICTGYEAHIGDLAFDPLRFPDPVTMFQNFRSMGFTLSVCAHAFAEAASTGFTTGQPTYWMRNATGTPLFVDWVQGNVSISVAVLDVTDAQAQGWFYGQINALMSKYTFSMVHVVGGQASLLPANYVSSSPLASPSDYAGRLAGLAASLTGRAANTVQVAYADHKIGIGVSMEKRASTWTLNGGLASVITSSLVCGILGYSFVVPDVIGGSFGTPSAELMIRWAQVAAFLPTMELGKLPWNFGDFANVSVANSVKIQVQKHQSLASLFATLAQGVTGSQLPIIRPIWLAQGGGFRETQFLTVTDQFMIGDRLMVAPIVNEGQTARDIFIPIGVWQDVNNNNQKITGPTTLTNYPSDYASAAPSFQFLTF